MPFRDSMCSDMKDTTPNLVKRFGVPKQIPIVLFALAVLVLISLTLFRPTGFELAAGIVLEICLLLLARSIPNVFHLEVTSSSVSVLGPFGKRSLQISDIDKEKTRNYFLAAIADGRVPNLLDSHLICAKSGPGLVINRVVFDIGDVKEFLLLIGCG